MPQCFRCTVTMLKVTSALLDHGLGGHTGAGPRGGEELVEAIHEQDCSALVGDALCRASNGAVRGREIHPGRWGSSEELTGASFLAFP